MRIGPQYYHEPHEKGTVSGHYDSPFTLTPKGINKTELSAAYIWEGDYSTRRRSRPVDLKTSKMLKEQGIEFTPIPAPAPDGANSLARLSVYCKVAEAVAGGALS